MKDEEIQVLGITIIFILVGAVVGSIITGCSMANSYAEDLCVRIYSNTQDYKACLDRPWKEIIEEIRE